MSLFNDNIVLYTENIIDYQKIELINKFSTVTWYKSSIYCNQLYFYTLAKKCEKNLKTSPCTIASKI